MALLRIMTTINPQTAVAVPGGSAFLVYNTDNINWLTLASKTGSGGAASSFFQYQLSNGGFGKAAVKASVGAIASAAGVTTV